MQRLFKADLHCHSHHSNKPSIWALRKFNCPESFSEPKLIYDRQKRRGMDHVTITDHNSISGAMEIAHLPGAFVSVEITTYFVDSGCKVHVVALDVSEEQFNEINRLRKNILDLRDYLVAEKIAHFVAHPLYDLNKRLTVDLVEQLLLLFNVFEVRNGQRDARFNLFTEELLTALTPKDIERMADRHGIDPLGGRPWIKGMVGGSDDHGGMFLGRAYTVAMQGDTLEGFLSAVMERNTWAGGEDGNSLTIAHSIYSIAYRFFNERFNAPKKGGGYHFLRHLTEHLFDEGAQMSLPDKFRLLIYSSLGRRKRDTGAERLEEVLEREAMHLLAEYGLLKRLNSKSANQRVFNAASFLLNRLLFIYIDRLTKNHRSLGLFGLMDAVTAMGLSHLLVSPYYAGFHVQSSSRHLMKGIAGRFGIDPPEHDRDKVALFTDTLSDINGVAITIRRILETARRRGIDFTVMTSTSEEAGEESGVRNFQEVGSVALPEYPELSLSFPPLLDMIDYVQREKFTRIHISTPGSVGLAGLFVAKLLDLPVAGTYHTDIPRYVKSLTDDLFMENAAWNFMIWFYSQMDEVAVPSASTRRQLVERGLSEEHIRPLPRWVDSSRFHPMWREKRIWSDYGLGEALKFLYVGRVSKEKGLPLLAEAFRLLVQSEAAADLIIVGDGPYREEMERELGGLPARFAGFRTGEELQRLYASADVFVFPSATDTFGNVVLEAQASGLPVIVADEGGPQELIQAGTTGLVVKAHSASALASAMIRLAAEPSRVAAMGSSARRFIERNEMASDEMYSTILSGAGGRGRHWHERVLASA